MDELILYISGMSSGESRSLVTAALKDVPGVERVRVDLSQNEATIWGTASRQELVKAVTAAGFGVSVFPIPEARGIG